ncbi:MAG: hypothetical protein JWQ35_1717 [Bacteriovoracaceae bacterium]|nr:hypothetical protein [Bacteriovoracaceae bacterium]
MGKSSLIVITTSSQTKEKLRKDLSETFELEIVNSGANALKSIQKNIPAAIVMDHSLEDYLTYQFIDKVRNNPATRNFPFIIISRESSNTFVEQGVRSGISHYIGVPYESKMLVEKLKMALSPDGRGSHESYFDLPATIQTQIGSYGRISYISKEGIHFETHLKLDAGKKLDFKSPLSDALGEQVLSIQVTQVGTDVFYNYPFAVDAIWTDPTIIAKVDAWIKAHRNLDSPKKSKILFIGSDVALENKIVEVINRTQYSPRFEMTLEGGMMAIKFMKPSCVVVEEKLWQVTTPAIQQRFLKELQTPWILFGSGEPIVMPEGSPQPFYSPLQPGAVEIAVRNLVPPKPPDPDRLYFSKALEDSRLKIFFQGKVLVLGELGVTLVMEHEVVPPCNLQLDLKTFTAQDFRNPYIRVWPPVNKISGPETENGKFKYSVRSHFLGINDTQGQAIRQWLREEELKEKKKQLADITPKPKPVEKPPEPKK